MPKSINRLAFWVSSLDSSIGSRIVRGVNAHYRSGGGGDIAVFFAKSSAPSQVPCFAAFNATEAYDYSGVVVATDAHSAASLLRCPGPVAKYFLVTEPEWTNLNGWSYLDLANVYRNPRLEIIADGDELRRMVGDCWNRDVAVDASVDDISNFLKVIFHV